MLSIATSLTPLALTLIPSGFTAGVAAAVAAGMATVILVPFGFVLYKLLQRTGGIHWLNWKTLLAAAGIVAAIVGVSVATSQPLFCNTCHIMRPSVSNWEKGPHKNVGCLNCHREKGFGGVTIRKLEDVRLLVANVYRSETRGLNKPIRDEICLTCHADVATEPSSEEGKVRVSHREFVGQNIACADCHIGTSHGKPERPKAVVMEKCSTCHNGKQVSADCDICHVQKMDKKKKPPTQSGIGHGVRWVDEHGVKSQGICTACHTVEQCGECHREVPHPKGWSLQHGKTGTGKRAACEACHANGRSCDNCHQLPLPHPAGWLRSHAESAEQRGDKTCYTCHLDRDCASCHNRHKGEHKDVPQLKRLKQKDG